MMLKNLTRHEIASLPHSCKLTDGHAFRRWYAAEEANIRRSAQRCKDNTRLRQVDIERDYIRPIHLLSSQTSDEDVLGYLMCITASMALVGEGLQFPQ